MTTPRATKSTVSLKIECTVSGKVKRASAGGALLLLAGAAAAPRGLIALGLAGGALANAGEKHDASPQIR